MKKLICILMVMFPGLVFATNCAEVRPTCIGTTVVAPPNWNVIQGNGNCTSISAWNSTSVASNSGVSCSWIMTNSRILQIGSAGAYNSFSWSGPNCPTPPAKNGETTCTFSN